MGILELCANASMEFNDIHIRRAPTFCQVPRHDVWPKVSDVLVDEVEVGATMDPEHSVLVGNKRAVCV